MDITDIKLRKSFFDTPLEAIYSVTFDNELVLHDVKLVNKNGSYLVVMPNRRVSDGEYKDIVHPINSAFRHKIEEQIVKYHINACRKGENPS